MENIKIEPTKKSLEAECSPGYFKLSGNSILSDPRKFFKPIVEWVDSYLQDPEDVTTIDLKLEYVDTASVQSVFDIMRMFKVLQEQKKELVVNFYFEFDDPELLELGEIMEGRLGIKFNFIEYQ
ncbi:MAG: SiaC family regulatory phosphoprotein [Bacteroidales bacterium]